MKYKLILLIVLLCSCAKVDSSVSKSLQESVIVLDPGHGGKDNGASYGVLIEDELNLEITLLISNYLISKGAIVYLTRDGDYDLSDKNVSNKKKDDLKERLKIINNFNPDVFVSVHMNTYPSSDVNGAQAFYYKDDKLAKNIQNELNKLNEKDKNSKKGDIYLLRNSLVPSCLIECGFVTGREDYINLQSKEYKSKIAEFISLGIEKYLLEK